MSKQRLVTVLLLSWMLLGARALIENLLPEPVQICSGFVTETDNYIQIENDYYIAKVSKGWHGHISDFYIKPETSVNIVARGQWDFLGGHETCYAYNGTDRMSIDWGLSNCKESQITEIVYQTSDVVVTRCLTEFKNSDAGNYVDMTILEYIAFYRTKSYYLVMTERTHNEQLVKVYNNQYCWLFNDTWGDTFYRLTHNDTVQTRTGGEPCCDYSVGIWESQYLHKYPWVMMFNTTYNHGHFSILLSATPHHMALGMLGTSADAFKEYQINYVSDSAEAGDTWYATVLSGVAENTTYVDDLANSLWSDDVIQTDSDNSYRVTSNPKIEKSDKRKWKIGNQLGAYFYAISTCLKFGRESGSYERPILGNEDNADGEWWLFWMYDNSTSYYSLYNWTDLSITDDYSWDASFTNVTLSSTWENKWEVETILEVWNDSDSFYLTHKFTLLKDANVTYLKAYWKINEPQNAIDIASLNSTVWKVNASDYYIDNMCDNGVVFHDINGACEKIGTDRYASYSFFSFYARYNSTEQLFSQGTSWTIKLLVQPFKRYSSQGLGYFGLNNVKFPEDNASETITHHHKLCWNRFPLNDISQPFRINHYGKGFLITEATATSEKLTLKVVGESGTTGNIKVYCGSKGEPRRVSGATSWSYNKATKILTATIKVTHSSEQRVEIQWGAHTIIPPHVYFHLWQQNTYINFASTTSLDNITQTNDKLYLNQYWFSVENANLTISKFFTSYQLIFIVNAPSQNTSTTKVYVDDWGEPTSVYATNGTLTWSYDPSTKTLTLEVVHSSPVEIIVDWRILGDVDGDGDVDPDDFYIFSGAYGTSPPSNPECDLDRDGDVDPDDFYIFAGNYGKSL